MASAATISLHHSSVESREEEKRPKLFLHFHRLLWNTSAPLLPSQHPFCFQRGNKRCKSQTVDKVRKGRVDKTKKSGKEPVLRKCGYKPSSSPWHKSSPYYSHMIGSGPSMSDEETRVYFQTAEEEPSESSPKAMSRDDSSSLKGLKSTDDETATISVDVANQTQISKHPPIFDIHAGKMRASRKTARTQKVPCLRPGCSNCWRWFPRQLFDMSDDEGSTKSAEEKNPSCIVRLIVHGEHARRWLQILTARDT